MNVRGSLFRRWWIYPIVAIVGVLIVFTVFSTGDGTDTSLRDFTDFVRAGQVTSIRVSRDDRRIEYTLEASDVTYETRKEARVPLRDLLRDAGVSEGEIDRIDIEFGASDSDLQWISLILNFLPIIIILGIVLFFLRIAMNPQKLRAQMFGLVTNADPVCGKSVNPGSGAGTQPSRGSRTISAHRNINASSTRIRLSTSFRSKV